MNFGPSFNEVFERIAFQAFLEQLGRRQQLVDDATITELEDDFASTSNRGSERSVTSSIEKLMKLEEQSASYLEQERFHEAYGVLKTQHGYGSKIYFAPVLVKYYVCLMQTERTEEADTIRDELITTLDDKFRDSPEDTCSYAKSLQKRGEYCQALLFYQVSLHYAEKKTPPRFILELPQDLAHGVRDCAVEMLEKNLISKNMLQTYVVPILSKVREQARRTIIADMGLSSLIQSSILASIEILQFLSGDLMAQGATLKEAITLIRRHHGRQGGSKFKLYGHLLEHLGNVCMLLNKPTDALKMLNQAVAALKKAKDFNSPQEKTKELQRIQDRLKIISKTA